MTLYQYLQMKSDECLQYALLYLKRDDFRMAQFYKNASIGFEKRKEKYTIQQLTQKI